MINLPFPPIVPAPAPEFLDPAKWTEVQSPVETYRLWFGEEDERGAVPYVALDYERRVYVEAHVHGELLADPHAVDYYFTRFVTQSLNSL